jgi:peroxiredoxin
VTATTAMAAHSAPADLGSLAPDFELPGTCGRIWTRDAAAGPNGLLVMFICNHCPYVQAVLDRIVRDAREIQAAGIGVVAISSNDAAAYPEDSFEQMQRLWREKERALPYLYDESQVVARAYGAVCTPDFFGYNRDLQLQYHGRIDASGRQPAPADAKRELRDALLLIARTGRGPPEQTPSIGCSIKWK